MSSLLRFVPGPLISWAGRVQFRYPLLRPLIHGLGQRFLAEGVVQRGPAKGLRIDASGTNPGFLAGTTEPLEQALLAKCLKPGAVFYDLGANIGFYALLGARCVTASGRVFAFEPTPAMGDRIRKNARLNGIENIEIVHKAVSNRDGRVGFDVVSDLSTRNRISDTPAADGHGVEATTIDTFAASHPPPDVMLIDIEGSEIDALEGGLQTIARSRPTILVEVHWLGDRFTQFVQRHLAPLGYTCTTYDGQPPPVTGGVRYHALLTP